MPNELVHFPGVSLEVVEYTAMRKIIFLVVSLFLIIPVGAVGSSPPDVSGHWQLDKDMSSGRYGAFALPDQELEIKKTPAGFAVHTFSTSKGWSLDDLYILDGKPHPIEIVSPDGTKLSGTRQVRFIESKKELEGVELLTTLTLLGRAKVKREFHLKLDAEGRLVLDSVEQSPLGQKTVHSVFRRSKD